MRTAQLKTLLGKRVTAIGDCGMTKDKAVTGILEYNSTSYSFLVIEDSGRVCSINEYTVELSLL